MLRHRYALSIVRGSQTARFSFTVVAPTDEAAISEANAVARTALREFSAGEAHLRELSSELVGRAH